MKTLVIGLFFSLFTTDIIAVAPFIQHNDSTVNPADSVKKQQNKTLNTYFGYGFSNCIGPENAAILIFPPPKFSFTIYHEKSEYEIYYGVDAAAHIFLAYVFSGSVFGGIKRRVFTFDTSVAYLQFPKQETEFDGPMDMYERITLNPKIGINYKWFWLKAGPSFELYRNPVSLHKYKFNLTYFECYNFEVGLHWLFNKNP